MASEGPHAFSGFHPAVRAWFEDALGEPTPAQKLGWPPIARGENTLILAPTGSGKTLAAFLHCLNRLYVRPGAGATAGGGAGDGPQGSQGVRVLYVSPLRALNNDIHRNLEVPLSGISAAAAELGFSLPQLRSAVRTGDTPPAERRRMLRRPPHILITTPESLFLLLCSRAREMLRTVETAIVDEIHALFPNKRGTQLSLALEQLQSLTGRPVQRIGLSATQRPLDQIAAFLGGGDPDGGTGTQAGLLPAPAGAAGGNGLSWRPRPVTVIEAGGHRPLDLRVRLPVRDFQDLPEHSVWPEMYRAVWRMVQEHRSTLVFVNSRQVGERVAAALCDLAGEEICRVHHGSIAREVRLDTERRLKAGELRCLVATSSLELGIDIGAIDLVIQIESPHEVARGLQRVGRAAHVPGLPSRGRILPKTRHDLLEATVLARAMLAGRIERARARENALDVLAQFLVGAATGGALHADDLYVLARRSYNYRNLSREDFQGVLEMISGAFDTGEYLGLRPLVYLDRARGTVAATERGRRLVFSSGGTIPDTGQFAVVLEGSGARLGELDEEFVSERRLGDRFTFGTSSWAIVELRPDRVVVRPSSGGPRVPFWRGETLGRSPSLGRAMSLFLREAEEALSGGAGFWERLAESAALDQDGLDNLRELLRAQRDATGFLPSPDRLLVEEFRDELGQWRVVVHSFLGRRVNEPLAMLIADDIERKLGRAPDLVVTDDGVMLCWTASEEPPALDLAGLAGPELTARVARLFRASPLFGLLFRQAAGRALILPRAPYGRRRTPLWLARRKASGLLALVERMSGFPLVTEAFREGLSSVYDLESLRGLLDGIATGDVGLARVRRQTPSPFARPLVFAATGGFLYTDDLPAAERRVRFLGLDPDSLAELLGQAPMRELLDPAAITETTRRAGPEGLRARPPENAEELDLWMLRFGELVAEDVPEEVASQLAESQSAGRVQLVSWNAGGGVRRAWVAAEEAATYRLALSPGPANEHSARRAAVAKLLLRFARRHTPFAAGDAADWYGVPERMVSEALESLAAEGRLRSGEFDPGGHGKEWADPLLLEEMHRRSLAAARRAVEPVPAAGFAQFLQQWQGLSGEPGPGASGPGRALAGVLSQLAGLYLPAGSWEAEVLPLRVEGYSPASLDVLLAGGSFRWSARGAASDLKVAFWSAGYPAEGRTAEGAPAAPARASLSGAASQVLEALRRCGALFFNNLWRQLPELRPGEVLAALEELLAAGEVTCDTFGPVRHLLSLGAAYRSMPRQVTPAVLGSMGRWSATGGCPLPSAGEACELLLGRYGILSREVAAAEGAAWGELLPPLARREVLGRVRRGYFVRGLGGLQYALPQAVESLRQAAGAGKEGRAAGLPGGDPALAWGRILQWPESGAQPRQPVAVAMLGGVPVLAAEGRPVRIRVLRAAAGAELAAALGELMEAAALVFGPAGRVEVSAYDERPVLGGPVEKLLAAIGFIRGPQTMVRWLGGLAADRFPGRRGGHIRT